MPLYYTDKTPHANGHHQVHKLGCKYMPDPSHWLYLGDFTNCQDAVRESMKTYRQSNGCVHCSGACHATD